MNRLLTIMLCFYSCISFAQKNDSTNSVYYFLDTVRTPSNERMWMVSTDKVYKYYSIKCTCLENRGKPTFIYDINKNEKVVIGRERFKHLKFIKLSTLIDKSECYLSKNGAISGELFFIIEPEGKNYSIRSVQLVNSAGQFKFGPDVFKVKPDTSAFKAEGLIIIDPKDVSKYIGKSVITTGKVLNTKLIGNYEKVLLDIGNPDQYFTIIIKDKNTDKFDSPEQYFNKKRIKVTGTVMEYMGKPYIEISDPNQIQVLR